MMRRFLFDCGTRDGFASAGLLVLRAGTGLMMLFGHGLGKLQGFEAKKDGFPVPSVWPLAEMSKPVSLAVTIFAEVGCAGLIVLGLATRPAAFVLGLTMLVAAFDIHGADPFFLGGGAAKEPALLYLIPCLALVLSGAGTMSLDRAIYQEKKKRFF